MTQRSTYTSTIAITAATRSARYHRLALLISHLDGINLNLVSARVTGNNMISVTLDNPIPDAQFAHLSLDEAP